MRRNSAKRTWGSPEGDLGPAPCQPTASRGNLVHGMRFTPTALEATVLVVDDDPAFRRLATLVLAAFGLGVIGEAATVATALAVAVSLRPEAALVDVGLPDGDGITLACQLV